MTGLRALEPEEYPYLNYKAHTFSLGVLAQSTVWVSGNTASRFDPLRGRVVVEGDVVAQARIVFDKLRLILAADRLSLGDVSRLRRYVTPEAIPHLDRIDGLQAALFGAHQPRVTTIAVERLLRGGALIEIDAVAGPGARIHLPSIAAADLGTAETKADRLLRQSGLGDDAVMLKLIVSTPDIRGDGVAPTEANGKDLRIVVPRLPDRSSGVQIEISVGAGYDIVHFGFEGDPSAGDVVGQYREICARLVDRLASLGLGVQHIVKTTEFITPSAIAGYRGTADVRREAFDPPYPAATGVICTGLRTCGALIAVEAIAVRS